jgi:hypothetical protein
MFFKYPEIEKMKYNTYLFSTISHGLILLIQVVANIHSLKFSGTKHASQIQAQTLDNNISQGRILCLLRVLNFSSETYFNLSSISLQGFTFSILMTWIQEFI